MNKRRKKKTKPNNRAERRVLGIRSDKGNALVEEYNDIENEYVSIS